MPRNNRTTQYCLDYQAYNWPKCNYKTFYQRIKKYWLSFEKAISTRRYNSKVFPTGRICITCWIRKEWMYFGKDKYWVNSRTSNCMECRRKIKIEYRKNPENREKAKEFNRRFRLKNKEWTKFNNIYYTDPIIKQNRLIIWKQNRKQARQNKIDYFLSKGYSMEKLKLIYK